MEETTITTIMASLSTLTQPQFSNLTTAIISATNHQNRRLTTVLSSPTLFSLTLHHLHTLSLSQKSLLISRHLLSSLHTLTLHHTEPPPPPPSLSTLIVKQRDLDAVLLLLLFCETHNHNPKLLEAPFSQWRAELSNLLLQKLLSVTVSCEGTTIVIGYLENIARCRRLVGALGSGGGGGNNKEVGEVAASAAAVVALPAVEVAVGGRECVICKEEMRVGRDVCELPCKHSFHWICILPWLGKRNTCPSCRFRLPSDHVFGEIQRLWDFLVKIGGQYNNQFGIRLRPCSYYG